MEEIGRIDRGDYAVLMAAIHYNDDPEQVEEHLDELEFLARTAGIRTRERFTQRISSPNPRYYFGSGKVAEVADYVKENGINIVIFDDELSPSQTYNLEQRLHCNVLDRTTLILNIFTQRATTANAKKQVELARYEYMLPRLVGMWTHLSRQRGGIGMRGGGGERELETDRRAIRKRISKLKDDLEKIDRQMANQRGNRGNIVRVSLVGYTNTGKSTIMNILSKSDVFAEDKLFATLDTTVRRVNLDNLPLLLSDTVGFIRKLPTQLVEAFKSTLDEVRESDILLHVIDISHPYFDEQIEVVQETLNDIGAGDKPTLLLFNKIDQYRYVKKEDDDLTPATEENVSLEELQRSWVAKSEQPSLFISATEGINIDELRKKLYLMVREIHTVRYPYDDFLY